MLLWVSLWDGQSNDGKDYRHRASGTKSFRSRAEAPTPHT